MKRIVYQFSNPVKDPAGNVQHRLLEKLLPYSPQNEELAAAEAHMGVYTVVEDGLPEPAPSQLQRLEELEEALEMILSGVTE